MQAEIPASRTPWNDKIGTYSVYPKRYRPMVRNGQTTSKSRVAAMSQWIRKP